MWTPESEGLNPASVLLSWTMHLTSLCLFSMSHLRIMAVPLSRACVCMCVGCVER